MLRLSDLVKVCWGAVALLAFSGAAVAAEGSVSANVTSGKNIFENGKPDGSVAACSGCHGEKAMGMDAMGTPRLANIGYAYIVKQLTDFAGGKRVATGLGEAMAGFAKALSEQEKRDVAAYVTTLPKSSEPSDLKALKEGGTAVGESYKGQILVRYGVEGKVSACISCHGYNGRGADPVYPKIGQQKYVYLATQLTHWRDGSRANDPMGQMRAVAKNLTDADINDIAAYLVQAQESSAGDGMDVSNVASMKNVKITK
jgi:cytochrome c553